MSIWQAFWFWVLVFTGISIVLPLLALLGWNLYVHLARAVHAWKLCRERELTRLGTHPLPKDSA